MTAIGRTRSVASSFADGSFAADCGHPRLVQVVNFAGISIDSCHLEKQKGQWSTLAL